MEICSRHYPVVTDVEHDFARLIEELRNPAVASQVEIKRLLAHVQQMDRVPDPAKFCAALTAICESRISRHLVTKVPKRKADPTKSVIHQQLAKLKRGKKKFSLVIADPPWEYNDKADAGERGASHKYEVMSITDIQELKVQDICADNAVLMLWGTWPLIDEARSVIRSWGFKYKTVGFVWVKENKLQDTDFVGGGHYTRSNSEYCLIGVRGKGIERVSKAVRQVIRSKIGEHSQKPEEFYTRFLELYKGKVTKSTTVELFGRKGRKNITVLGNDVDRYGSE